MDLGRRALDVAPELLGCVLRFRGVAVRLVEVEAYEGAEDPASHAWRGKTARNASMFDAGGRIYVYTMHGYACMNIVCGPEGLASAVLVRAGEVVEGLAEARLRRPRVRDDWLARGPGNLCRSLGITRADDGTEFGDSGLELLPGTPPDAVAVGPRVNVSRAWDRPWRFWDAASPAVSAAKRHPAVRAGSTGGQASG